MLFGWIALLVFNAKRLHMENFLSPLREDSGQFLRLR